MELLRLILQKNMASKMHLQIYEAILNDPETNTVFITTGHDSHAYFDPESPKSLQTRIRRKTSLFKSRPIKGYCLHILTTHQSSLIAVLNGRI